MINEVDEGMSKTGQFFDFFKRKSLYMRVTPLKNAYVFINRLIPVEKITTMNPLL